MIDGLTPKVFALRHAPAQAWRNGGGVTHELLCGPSLAEGQWRYRISVAQIASDGAFSSFPGMQRHFAVLSGQGVDLTIDGIVHRLQCTSAALSFSGQSEVMCRLIDGPSLDLNFMVALGAQPEPHDRRANLERRSGLHALSSGQAFNFDAPGLAQAASSQASSTQALRCGGLFTTTSGTCHWQGQHSASSKPLGKHELLWFADVPESLSFTALHASSYPATVAWAMHLHSSESPS
jgi:uncharacterized protein